MNRAIRHRGPDNQSVWNNEQITFGHVRLSIIDTSSNSNQPFHYSHQGKNYTIVYNGEVYNYIEIKKTLQLANYKFISNSDTEVVIAAFDFWGEDCVQQFNGMWAFSIYDHQKNILFCSRDRLGEKPFCYYYNEGKFIFSSEIKAILEHKDLKINTIENINREAIQHYFSSGLIPSPLSIYNRVYKLEAGHNLIFDINTNALRNYKYFNIEKQDKGNNKGKLLEEIDYLFNDSINLRMRSDVPVGAFLSGGIDSTSIVCGVLNDSTVNDLHTFSIGFEGVFDETEFIQKAADSMKGITHHHEYYSKNNWKSSQETYSLVYDEPFSDYSGYPTLHLSEMAKRKTIVVQSGDGGDEIFGGYYTYNHGLIIEKLRKLPLFLRRFLGSQAAKSKIIDLKLFSEAIRLSLLQNNLFWAEFKSNENLYSESYRRWAENKMTESLYLASGNLPEALRIYDLLFNTLSDRFLTKVDKASMHHSIEVRAPFLDFRFVELSLRIPEDYKFKLGKSKILLKEYIKTFMPKVPAEIVDRKKKGFTPPIRNWITEDDNYGINPIYLDTLRKLYPEAFQYYSKLLQLKSLNTFELEQIIKLRLFLDWYAYWIENNNRVKI